MSHLNCSCPFVGRPCTARPACLPALQLQTPHRCHSLCLPVSFASSGTSGLPASSASREQAELPLSPRTLACQATAEVPRESAPASFSWPAGFEERFELGDLLGRGSFGVVRMAFDRKTGRTLAVKVISKTRPNVEAERIAHRIKEEVSSVHVLELAELVADH